MLAAADLEQQAGAALESVLRLGWNFQLADRDL